MNTAYLKTFVEVVNIQSFSQAAEKLCLTQPAVTKQIKALENDLGKVLIIRTGDIILTKEGKDLYQYAIAILNKEEELYSKIRNSNTNISGRLTIYSSSIPASYLLDEIIYNFSNQFNNISFHLIKSDSKNVYDKILSGNTSFGFTGIKIEKPNINTIEIFKDKLVVAVSSLREKEFKGREISLDSLFKQEFIIREKGSATFKIFENILKHEGYTIDSLRIKGVFSDNEIIKKMILKDFGISVISELSIDKEIRDGSIIPLKIKGVSLERSIYYAYHKKRYFNSLENHFKDFILESVASQND